MSITKNILIPFVPSIKKQNPAMADTTNVNTMLSAITNRHVRRIGPTGFISEIIWIWS
jgi:hypothetical protein